jgi:hypothetical protein
MKSEDPNSKPGGRPIPDIRDLLESDFGLQVRDRSALSSQHNGRYIGGHKQRDEEILACP